MKLRHRMLLRLLEALMRKYENPSTDTPDDEVLRIVRMSAGEFRTELQRGEARGA